MTSILIVCGMSDLIVCAVSDTGEGLAPMTSPAPFQYVEVDTWDAAVAELVGGDEDTKILAGGQSLVPMLNLRLARPSALIDVNRIATPPPTVNEDMLVLPALTRHRTLVESPLIGRHLPMLATAVTHVGNVRVRNRGTIGGSLAHADPTAEISCVALALGADLVVQGPTSTRTIPSRELFVTYLTTVLEPTEVVTEVRFPTRSAGQGTSFMEHVRRASDFATVGIAASVQLEDDLRTVRSARVALVGVGDRPELAGHECFDDLIGSTGAAGVVAACAARVAAGTDPDSDVHASGSYRKHLVEVLTRRTLSAALSDARTQVR